MTTFQVNGQTVTVDVPADMPVLWVLRDVLGITGPKYGCGINVCKACTSHLDGKAFNPCNVPVSAVAGRSVTTIEGLATGDTLHPVQQAWVDHDVAQCGYCQPGQIMSAAALIAEKLAAKQEVTDADIDALENVCRCGTYGRIRTAIKAAAVAMATPGVVAGAPTTTAGTTGTVAGAPALAATGLPVAEVAGAAALIAAAVAATRVARRGEDDTPPLT